MAFTLKAKSLITNPNELSRAEGALDVADNVVIDRDDIIEPRRGFEHYSNGLGALSDNPKQLITYKDRVIAHYTTKIAFDSGLGEFLDFDGDYTELSSNLRIRSIEFGGNLYFTSIDGIKKISATSADDFTTDAGYITNAGGVKAVDLSATLSASDSGFLPPQSKVAYRVLWGTKDVNNRLVLGSPSARFVLTNPNTNTTTNEKFTITVDDYTLLNSTSVDYILFNSANLGYFLWFNLQDDDAGSKPVFEGSIQDIGLSDNYVTIEALDIGASDIVINLDTYGAGGTDTLDTVLATYNQSVPQSQKVILAQGSGNFIPNSGITITLENGSDPIVGDTVPKTAETIGRTAIEIDLTQETSLTNSKVADIIGNTVDGLVSFDVSVAGNVVTLTSTEDGEEMDSAALGAFVQAGSVSLTIDQKGGLVEGQYANAELNVTIPEEITTNYFIQVYRTRNTTAVAGLDLNDIDPGEEFNLVYEEGVSEGQTEFIIEDIQSESFRDSGAPLYTNPLTGEGIINANERPPIATDIAAFQNSAFYANTKRPHTTTTTLLSVTDFISEESTFTVGNEDVVREYQFVGATKSQDIKTRADDTSKQTTEITILSTDADLDQSYIVLQDDEGSVAFWIDLDNSGSAVPSHGADRPIEVTTVTTGMTVGQVGTELYNAIIADSKFVGISDDTNGNIVVQSLDYGFRDPVYDGTDGTVDVFGFDRPFPDLYIDGVADGESIVTPWSSNNLVSSFIGVKDDFYIFNARKDSKIGEQTSTEFGFAHIKINDLSDVTFIPYSFGNIQVSLLEGDFSPYYYFSPSGNIYVPAIDEFGDYTSSERVYVSTDGGYIWKETLVPSDEFVSTAVQADNTHNAFVISEGPNGDLYYFEYNPTGGHIIRKSLDNGISWNSSTTVSSFASFYYALKQFITVDSNENIYLITQGRDNTGSPVSIAVFKSTDGGANFTEAFIPYSPEFSGFDNVRVNSILQSLDGECYASFSQPSNTVTYELVSNTQYVGINVSKDTRFGEGGFLYGVTEDTQAQAAGGIGVEFYKTPRDFSTFTVLGTRSSNNEYYFSIDENKAIFNRRLLSDPTRFELVVVQNSPLQTDEITPGSNGTLSGSYFYINSASNERKYYVWFNNGVTSNTDPALSNDIGGRSSVEVKILPSDSANSVASALSTSLSNLGDFITPSVFNESVTYDVGDKVTYVDGTIYICIQKTTDPEFQNPSNSLYWQFYASPNVINVEWFKNGVVDPIQDFGTDFEFFKKQNILVNRSPSQLNSTYFHINSVNNATEYYVWFSDGTGVDPSIPNKTGIQVLLSPTDGVFEIAPKLATALDNLDDFNASDDGANVIITWPDAKPVDDIVDVDTLLNITVTFENNAVEGKGENTDNQIVLLSSLASAAQSIDETARSLVKVINRDPLSPVYAFYDSGANDLPGIVRLENRSSEDVTFYLGTTSEITSKFDPVMPEVYSIVSISAENPTQIVTAKDHGLSTGEFIYIHSTNSTPSIQGKYEVTVPDPINNPNMFTIPVQVTTAGTVGFWYRTTIESDNDAAENRLYYSKTNLPEAVPLLNYIDIGPKDEPIQRIIPLRDSLFVLKTDGVYVVSGTTAPNFSSRLLDRSVQIYAPDTATVLNNRIYVLSTQGVVSISESGVSVVSRPIENKILEVVRSGSNYQGLSFGLVSESDRAYHLWLPTSATDDIATQCYRYNTFTRAWTRWTKSASCGVDNVAEDLLYLGSGDFNVVEVERKSGERYDYADRSFDLEIGSGGVSGTSVEVSSAADLQVGDAILQEVYVTIPKVRMLLKTLDIDSGFGFSTFFDDYAPSTGADMRFVLNDINTKLVELDTSGTITAQTFVGSFENVRDQYNLMISQLNDPACDSTNKNYPSATDLVPYEVVIESVNKQNNFVNVNYEYPFIQGDITIYKSYECEVVYAAQHFGKPDTIKQIREATMMFDQSNFYKSYISFATDISPHFEEEDFPGRGRGDFGDLGFGASSWGGKGDETPSRSLIPRDKQRCRYIRVKLRHINAREEWAVVGVSFEPRLTSSRGYR